MPDATLWNERLARYRSLAARAEAAAETGWFRVANDLYYRESADPAADHGAAFARLDRAEDLYWRRCTAPLEAAAVALALTTAPDVKALREKIVVIRTHQLHEADSMLRDCFSGARGGYRGARASTQGSAFRLSLSPMASGDS